MAGSRVASAVVLCLLFATAHTLTSADFKILNISFSSGATYSASTAVHSFADVTVYFLVTAPGGISPNDTSGNAATLALDLPHKYGDGGDGYSDEMFFGVSQSSSFAEWPGSELGWTLYYPDVYPSSRLSAKINGTAMLPYLYVGKIRATSATMPTKCSYPGIYNLTINAASSTLQPCNRHVLCPELNVTNVTFTSNAYDSFTNLTFTAQVLYYNFYDSGPTTDPNNLMVQLPLGTLPQRYQVSSSSSIAFLSGQGSIGVTGSPSVQSSSSTSVPSTPTISLALVGNSASLTPGTTLVVQVTNLTTPWGCNPNGQYCLSLGHLVGCTTLSQEITGCPVLSNLTLSFNSSRYGSVGSIANYTFLIKNNPLYTKGKYTVTLNFPVGVGFVLANAYVISLPLGRNETYSGLTQIAYTSFAANDTTGTISFALTGVNQMQQTSSDIYVPPGQTQILIGGISMPSTCAQIGPFVMTIGAFSLTTSPVNVVKGCSVLSSLDVAYTPAWQATYVQMDISFIVSQYDLFIDPIRITYPYYHGVSQNFTVSSSPSDILHWSINGRANPNITVYRGLSYSIVVNPSSTHAFCVMQALSSVNISTGVLLLVGTLYTDGVTNNNLTGGTLQWSVGGSTPSLLYYQDCRHPLMWGYILVQDRPRGLDFSSARFGVRTPPTGAVGTAFADQLNNYWIHYDPIQFYTNGSGASMTETAMAFTNHNTGEPWQISPYPLFLSLVNVLLPSGDCSDLGNLTLQIGPAVISGHPASGVFYCPVLGNILLRYSSQVRGAQGVMMNLSYTVNYAPLVPQQLQVVTVVFPPDSGITLSPTAYFGTVNGDWNLTFAGPKVTNLPGIEISISQVVTGGTTVAPGQATWLTVFGVNMPPLGHSCSAVGSHSVFFGTFRFSAQLEYDNLLCPSVTGLEAQFTPTSNQSATTYVLLSFNITDSMDPGTIVITFPSTMNVTTAKPFNLSRLGWSFDPALSTVSGTQLTIPILGGPRLSSGWYQLVIRNVALPWGNCSDLGLWGLQIGPVLGVGNPALDVVVNCVTPINLNVTFSPDWEQGGTSVNMTFSFDIDCKTPLWFDQRDSSSISVVMPSAAGVRFGPRSTLLSALQGWTMAPAPSVLTPYTFSQGLTGGPQIPACSHTSFTITDVYLPNYCVDPGLWEFRVGIWKYYGPPVNGTALIGCPKIVNLGVTFQPPVQCSQLVTATVTFDVTTTRLRAGRLQMYFPPASGLIVWPFARMSVPPGNWVSLGGTKAAIVRTTSPGINVSYSETFAGSPLEVGTNYSFQISGMALPCDNCTDLGPYMLSVGGWASAWIEPPDNILLCPGMLTSISVGVLPRAPPRMYPNSTLVFNFTAPVCHSWNVLTIQLPDGFTVSNQLNTTIVWLVGASTTPQTEILGSGTSTISVRSLINTCSTNGRYSIALSNIGLCNNCNPGEFVLTLTNCGLTDRSAGQAPPIWWCTKGLGDATGTVVTAAPMPQGCTPCDACRVAHQDGSGNPVFSCEDGRAKFQRTQLDSGCQIPQTWTPNLY